SLRSIVIVNLTLLAGLTGMVLRIFARVADRLTATIACVVILTIFSFIQLLAIGNYNFVTPYSHEITHGVVLSFAGMACVLKWIEGPHPRPPPEYQGRGWAWLVGAGFMLGLIFLTKAEVFLAAASALVIGLLLAARGRGWRALGILAI